MDQGDALAGPNQRRRVDARVVPAYIHQKLFVNPNHDTEKKPDLNALIESLRNSQRVDDRELDVQRLYEELPRWVAAQPLQAQGHYRGMRSIMRRMHFNRCSYLDHLLKGRGAGYHECMGIEEDLKMGEKELIALQEKIDEAGGRVWKVPHAFSLPLVLLKEA